MRHCIGCGTPVECSYSPPRCSDCNSIRNKERYRVIADKLNEIKLALGCADCGYNEHPAALDFDHLPGTDKIFNLANAYRYGWGKVETELAKCEVVCANCHRVRTFERNQNASGF